LHHWSLATPWFTGWPVIREASAASTMPARLYEPGIAAEIGEA
jgi:hypothetical protein